MEGKCGRETRAYDFSRAVKLHANQRDETMRISFFTRRVVCRRPVFTRAALSNLIRIFNRGLYKRLQNLASFGEKDDTIDNSINLFFYCVT